ncbi:MAG: hypothetical protein JO057_25880, partial [Chloroflexi bacterium]|nr:hypothetical protein [Chloroflexota bacterium]
MAQSTPPILRTGPGFQEHHEMRDGQEHIDVNVCSTATAPQEAHCDARVRTDTPATTLRPARTGEPHPAGTLGN